MNNRNKQIMRHKMMREAMGEKKGKVKNHRTTSARGSRGYNF